MKINLPARLKAIAWDVIFATEDIYLQRFNVEITQ